MPIRIFFLAISLTLVSTYPLTSHATTIIYSNDVLGEIEPCGCQINPQGGMFRKAILLQSLRDQGEKNILQIDAGDLFFESKDIPENYENRATFQAQYVLKTHELLGHQIVVPGEKDFALGLSSFKNLIKGSSIQFLAANLKTKTGETILPPETSFQFTEGDGKITHISVLGVLGEKLSFPEKVQSELTIESPLPIIKKWVKEQRGKNDYLILVTHQGDEEDLKIAKAIDGIDWIIGSHSQSFLQEPLTYKKTKIVQSSFRNQYVGVISPSSTPEHSLIGLDVSLEKKPPTDTTKKMKKLIESYKKELKKIEKTN